MLRIIKASAGSGKTHRLTGEYIRLLFAHATNYRHILAVTFTNKATEEMKSRIIKELNRLAQGDSSDYLTDLREAYTKSEAEIRQQAKDILITILHDFSAFSISTIDRFFQQTVRSFAREVGLQGGYTIELDADDVLEQAIDRFLFDIDEEADKEVLNWLIRFAESRVEEGGSWNVRGNITVLAQELLKEKFKTHADELQTRLKDKSFLTKYFDRLMAIRVAYETQLRKIGQEGCLLMSQHGFRAADSSYKTFEFFSKIAAGEVVSPGVRLIGFVDNPDKWTAKAASAAVKSAAAGAFHGGLNNCLKSALAHLQSNIDYITACEILKQFYALGILVDIDAKMREMTKEKNIMLISDTTELLHRIIDGSDIPFVYEKVGTRVHHYMMDEFQDTSGMQWRNFSPLIHDSLASGRKNLIVGDVKQSIYRWRNSDWMLLNERLEEEVAVPNRDIEVLQTNWRSLPHIVAFNNTFFTEAARQLVGAFHRIATSTNEQRISQAYSDIYQQPSPRQPSDEGYISLTFFDADEDQNWQQQALDKLVSHVERLQRQGYRLQDIGVLVRTKAEGNSVAQRLLEAKEASNEHLYRYDFISDEALFIANSPAVGVIITLLTSFYHNEETLVRVVLGDALTPTRQEALLTVRLLPLFEMVESIILLFELNQQPAEGVFLQAFQDLVLDFGKNHASDLGLFLEWWNKSGVKRTLAAPTSQDAIQILTIHKSKGLEFAAVLIPFCEWNLDHSSHHTQILWSKPTTPPFDEMPLVPLKYSRKLLESHFAADYLAELLQVYIDKLNMAYVAFTRAREELIVFAPKYKKTEEPTTLAKLLTLSLNAPFTQQSEADSRPYLSLSSHWEEGQTAWSIGSPRFVQVEVAVARDVLRDYTSEPLGDRLRLRLNSKGFFNDREERMYGNLMHSILSRIERTDNLEGIISDAVLRGEISSADRPAMVRRLTDAIESSDLTQQWFNGSYRVMNEVQILHPSQRFLRPDRVMRSEAEIVVVDYKFGKIERTYYPRQVKNYVRLITEMGYGLPVKGYVWYVELNKLQAV